MTRNRRCVPAHGLTQQLSCVVHQGLDLVRLWRMGGSGVGYVFSSMFHFVYVDSLLAAHAKRWYIDRDSISAFFFFYLFPSFSCVCVCAWVAYIHRGGVDTYWSNPDDGNDAACHKHATKQKREIQFIYILIFWGCLKDVKLENTADFVFCLFFATAIEKTKEGGNEKRIIFFMCLCVVD